MPDRALFDVLDGLEDDMAGEDGLDVEELRDRHPMRVAAIDMLRAVLAAVRRAPMDDADRAAIGRSAMEAWELSDAARR